MQEKKPKKNKGLWILFSAIVAYIVIGGGFLLYDIFAEDIPNEKKQNIIQEQVEATEKTTVAYNAQEIAEMDEETFAREYGKFLESSFANVPARSPEEMEQTQEEVLVVVNDANTKTDEKPEGFFSRILGSVFGTEKPKQSRSKKNAVTQEMLTELESEIVEMQSNFMLYKDANGVAYIDHVNKPETLETNGFYIYIGVQPNGFTFHRTIIRYSGLDEIELKRILVQTPLSDNALMIDATADVLQQSFTTAVNEWVDLPPTQENIKLLNTVTAAGEVKVTFMGSLKNVEWVLSEDQLTTLKESLYFYKLLKEKEELSK